MTSPHLALDTPPPIRCMLDPVMHHLHLVIEGRVQGVGFRYFVLRQAQALGVAGRAWNRADGAVEIEAEGSQESLAEFLDALRLGPSGARVQRIAPSWSEGPAQRHDFLIA